jgi:tRNA(Leu) C34 or U34 (ribose-2'-O)-methylase TrmL
VALEEEQVSKKNPFKTAKHIKPVTPAIVMTDPRYPHNVGAAVRACSCFGAKQVWLTGKRVADKVIESKRLPREERMKGFSDVDIILEDRPFNYFGKNVIPVAVELLEGSENLYGFDHPENSVYVFGPEDGNIPKNVRQFCHRRIFIPTKHCTNLGAAVYLILNDRKMKRVQQGMDPMETISEALNESRGWGVDDDPRFESL